MDKDRINKGNKGRNQSIPNFSKLPSSSALSVVKEERLSVSGKKLLKINLEYECWYSKNSEQSPIFWGCLCSKENKHTEICDFGSGVVWGKTVHFEVVTAQNLKGFFKCDTVIIIKTKQNKSQQSLPYPWQDICAYFTHCNCSGISK